MERGRLEDILLGARTDRFLRLQSINLAVAGFLLHLLFCVLHAMGRIEIEGLEPMIDSYLDALYTPFSIILAYEVYELIRAIPESFSNSIGKQFEVVTLLVVRDILKNLADLSPDGTTSHEASIAFIAVEGVVFIVLFATALFFRRMASPATTPSSDEASLTAFVGQKHTLACCLVIVYLIVALYALTTWIAGVLSGEEASLGRFSSRTSSPSS